MTPGISRAPDLPHYPVDQIQWFPGWVQRPEDAFHLRPEALLAQDRWIIGGIGPWPAIERRFDAANTI
jgi:hypothetical protein